MRRHGFTLVEVIITVAMVSIIFVIASDFIINSMDAQRYISEQNDAIQESRTALKHMISEMREAVAADTGAYPIEMAADNEIIFYSDIDNDEVTERIHYWLVNEHIQRGVIEPTGVALAYIAENETTTTLVSSVRNSVTQPVFTYYDENYPADTVSNPLVAPVNPTDIRMVELGIFSNVDPIQIPDAHELRSRVHLRNLKENF